jgi:hypothetical protein
MVIAGWLLAGGATALLFARWATAIDPEAGWDECDRVFFALVTVAGPVSVASCGLAWLLTKGLKE